MLRMLRVLRFGAKYLRKFLLFLWSYLRSLTSSFHFSLLLFYMDRSSERTHLLNVNDIDKKSKYPSDFSEPGFGSFSSSTFNLACSAIGGGVLAFPFAYSNTGLISGLVITVIMIGVMYYSQHLISSCTQETRSSNYNELVTRMLGKRMGLACEIILVLYLLGAVIGFMTIIGELATPIVNNYITTNEILGSSKFLIVVFSVLIILPLCFPKRIHVLG